MTSTEISDSPCGAAGREPLPQALRDRLRERFSPRRAEYVARVLTAGELSVLGDLSDALIIARIERMSDRQLGRFEWLEPATAEDRRHYSSLQLSWLRDEEYLVGTRLGRPPRHRDLCDDFTHHENGLRFRAYFALKYPKRVRATRRRQRCVPGQTAGKPAG